MTAFIITRGQELLVTRSLCWKGVGRGRVFLKARGGAVPLLQVEWNLLREWSPNGLSGSQRSQLIYSFSCVIWARQQCVVGQGQRHHWLGKAISAESLLVSRVRTETKPVERKHPSVWHRHVALTFAALQSRPVEATLRYYRPQAW